jgi:hypothetical protein
MPFPPVTRSISLRVRALSSPSPSVSKMGPASPASAAPARASGNRSAVARTTRLAPPSGNTMREVRIAWPIGSTAPPPDARAPLANVRLPGSVAGPGDGAGLAEGPGVGVGEAPGVGLPEGAGAGVAEGAGVGWPPGLAPSGAGLQSGLVPPGTTSSAPEKAASQLVSKPVAM